MVAVVAHGVYICIIYHFRMREVLLLILVICSTSLVSGQQKNSTRIPLTVEIDEKGSMAATEVTVAQWMEFVAANDYAEQLFPDQATIEPLGYAYLFADLRNHANFQYLKVHPSKGFKKHFISAVEVRIKKEMEDKVKVNGFNPLLFPVTGISYDQAVQFCKWKQEYINSQNANSPALLIMLPSEEDYRTVITDSDSVSKQQRLMYNFRRKEVVESIHLVRSDTYWPNHFGLYCIQGNASEMTSTRGVAMGGSFAHYARQSYSDQRQLYAGVQSWLGFRYVVRLKQ